MRRLQNFIFTASAKSCSFIEKQSEWKNLARGAPCVVGERKVCFWQTLIELFFFPFHGLPLPKTTYEIKPSVSPWKFVWPNSTAISWHVTLPYLFYSCLQYDCWLLISPFIYCQMCASRILNQKMQPPKSTLWGRHPVLPVQKCLYHPVALCEADHFARSLHKNVKYSMLEIS